MDDLTPKQRAERVIDQRIRGSFIGAQELFKSGGPYENVTPNVIKFNFHFLVDVRETPGFTKAQLKHLVNQRLGRFARGAEGGEGGAVEEDAHS